MVLASLLLAGCSAGSGSDSTPQSGATPPGATGTPGTTTSKPKPAPTGPECNTIWKVGQKLPSDYTVCIVDGQTGEQEVIDCQDGTSLVVYRDEYYAITGEAVVEPDVAPLQDTSAYGATYSRCTGE